MLGMDGTNDPTVTIYDHATAASGNEVVPTNTYDASALGANGVMFPERVACENGIVVDVVLGGGNLEVTLYYS